MNQQNWKNMQAVYFQPGGTEMVEGAYNSEKWSTYS